MRFFILAATLAVVSAPVSATGIGDCVENALPAASKNHLAEQYLLLGKAGIERVPAKEDIGLIADQCLGKISGSSDRQVAVLTEMITAFVIKHATEHALVAKHRTSAEKLDTAWRSLTTDQRDRLAFHSTSKYPAEKAITPLITAIRPDFAEAKVLALMSADGMPKADREETEIYGLATDLTGYAMARQKMQALEKSATD